MVSGKVIALLLIIAIVFSVGSTLINLSLINFEFKPINVQLPSNIKAGNPTGNVQLIIEGNPVPGGGG